MANVHWSSGVRVNCLNLFAFLTVVLFGSPSLVWARNKDKTGQRQDSQSLSKSATPRSFIEKFFIDTLKVDEDSLQRHLLSLHLRQEIEIGFGKLGTEAFSSDGHISAEAAQALLTRFSPQSAKSLERLILSMGRDRYPNALLIGPAGVGKSFTLEQLAIILSFGVVPDFLQDTLGLGAEDSTFVRSLREAYFNKTQLVTIDHGFLSQDNTRPGKAFPDSDTRMRSMLLDVFHAAKMDFRENGVRTVFIMEEVAKLPSLVQEALKTLLDETGFKGETTDPLEMGEEVGFSVIGLTTPEELEKMVNGDSAVERRYERVNILEPTEEEALNILIGKKAKLQAKYGLNIDDSVLWYIISMRKFFSNPPLAMPDSVLKILNNLFLWCSNGKNRQHGNDITIDEAYRYLVEYAQLPKEMWLPSEGHPPLYDLAERVKARVIGHEDVIEKIARQLQTAILTGFSDFQIFILAGPTGSGKDTIFKAFNEEAFGHDGRHMYFDLSGATIHNMRENVEGVNGELPLMVRNLQGHSAHGLFALNEAADARSEVFNLLKVPLEEGVLRPRGRDTRPRPFGINALFLMGQWGEDILEGKTESEIQEIVSNMTEKQLIEMFRRGTEDGKKGALPDALIQRAIRNGGIYFLAPTPAERYSDIVKLNLKGVIENYRKKSQIATTVDDSLVHLVAELAIANNKGTRGLDGIVKDLTLTAISQAQNQGLPRYGKPNEEMQLHLSADSEGNVVIEQKEGASGAVMGTYKLPYKMLLRSKCVDYLLN